MLFLRGLAGRPFCVGDGGAESASSSLPARMSVRSRVGGRAEARGAGAGRRFGVEVGSGSLRGPNSDSVACGSPVALVTLLACERLLAADPRDTVERRDDSTPSGAAALRVAISWACSRPSRMGQFLAREPMTSICLSSEPWSHERRIWLIFWPSNWTMWTWRSARPAEVEYLPLGI